MPRIPEETPVGVEQRAEEQTDHRGMMGGMTEESDAVGTFEKEYMEIPLMEESRGHCQHSERRESLMEVVKRAREEIVFSQEGGGSDYCRGTSGFRQGGGRGCCFRWWIGIVCLWQGGEIEEKRERGIDLSRPDGSKINGEAICAAGERSF